MTECGFLARWLSPRQMSASYMHILHIDRQLPGNATHAASLLTLSQLHVFGTESLFGHSAEKCGSYVRTVVGTPFNF